MEELFATTGWNKKPAKRLADAIAITVAKIRPAVRQRIVEDACAIGLEDAFAEEVAIRPGPQPSLDDAVSLFGFVVANAFPTKTAADEAKKLLNEAALAHDARRSLSEGAFFEEAAATPSAGTVLEAAVSTPIARNPAPATSTIAETIPDTLRNKAVTKLSADKGPTRKITRRKCEDCGHTKDSCICDVAALERQEAEERLSAIHAAAAKTTAEAKARAEAAEARATAAEAARTAAEADKDKTKRSKKHKKTKKPTDSDDEADTNEDDDEDEEDDSEEEAEEDSEADTAEDEEELDPHNPRDLLDATKWPSLAVTFSRVELSQSVICSSQLFSLHTQG